MGITLSLKQISLSTLVFLKKEPSLVKLFYACQWHPEAEIEQKIQDLLVLSESKTRQEINDLLAASAKGCKPEVNLAFCSRSLCNRFFTEWEISKLGLHKYWLELTYLLAGFIPYSSARDVAIPELQLLESIQGNHFMDFTIIENSEWDGLPLVNAIFTGTKLTDKGANWYQMPEEVGQILDGLLWISESGFQERYQREAESEKPCPYLDFEEEEMLSWLTDYYNVMVDYYEDAVRKRKAILADLSI